MNAFRTISYRLAFAIKKINRSQKIRQSNKLSSRNPVRGMMIQYEDEDEDAWLRETMVERYDFEDDMEYILSFTLYEVDGEYYIRDCTDRQELYRF
jgi:hypothetical protein